MKGVSLDGRSSVVVLTDVSPGGVAITLHRTFRFAPHQTILQASFSNLVFRGSRNGIEIMSILDMASAVSLIIAVDAERALRRQLESELAPRVAIQVFASDIHGDIRPYFIERIVDKLKHRAVAIEPKDVPASVWVELIQSA